MRTHTDKNPSTLQESPELFDTAATPSGDIEIEKIEGGFGFIEDAEIYKEEELENTEINYEETELIMKEEVEENAEENEDFSKDIFMVKEEIEGEIKEDNADFFIQNTK